MMVLPLCQKFCSNQIPSLTQQLGDGADGEVFEIADCNDKVIKLCVQYEFSCKENFAILYHHKTSPVLDFLIQNPVEGFARVYSHYYLGMYERNSFEKKEKFLLYYYTMEKLINISGEENKVFHSILSHQDSGMEKNYSLDKIKKILKGLARGLDFDEKKVILFCENLRRAPVRHLDIHSRNIMKDKSGNFKLIDFDRCELRTI